MNVGEALWEIGFSAEEKERISHLLRDESSLNYRVFADHYKSQRVFDDICHKMTRTITGFRPAADPFRKRVYSAILGDLRKNKAKRDYWVLYQCTVAEFVIGNLSALNQLLSDTEVPENFDKSTDGILSLITDHAADYSAHDRDVEALYELWPFERTLDIRDYLSKCPKFDRFRAIDETVKSVETRLTRDLSDLKAHNAEEIQEIQSQLRSRVVSRDDFEEAVKSQRLETKGALESVEDQISQLSKKLAQVEKLLRRSEARRSADRNEFTIETEKHVDRLSQAINQLRNEHNQLSNDLEEVSANRGSIAAPAATTSDSNASPFSLLEHSESVDDRADLSVKEALGRFASVAGIGDSEDQNSHKIFFYTALLANCLLVLDRKEVDIWDSIVGWCTNSRVACASPLWVDEHAIAEHLFWLFALPDKPRCLAILDFDKGYVEGYLAPFLRAWRESATFKPWKKILLYPSGNEWTLPNHVASEVSVLPKVSCDSKAVNKLQSFGASYVPPAKAKKYLGKIGYDASKRADRTVRTPLDGAAGIAIDEFAQAQIIEALSLGPDVANKLATELGLFWNERCV